MNKAPVLSDEQIGKVLTIDFKETTGKDAKEYFNYISENDRVIAQAQRDADHKYYQGVIREIFGKIEKLNCSPAGIMLRIFDWQSLTSEYLEEK